MRTSRPMDRIKIPPSRAVKSIGIYSMSIALNALAHTNIARQLAGENKSFKSPLIVICLEPSDTSSNALTHTSQIIRANSAGQYVPIPQSLLMINGACHPITTTNQLHLWYAVLGTYLDQRIPYGSTCGKPLWA